MAYTDTNFTYEQDFTADNEKQLVDLLTPIFDGESLHRRKDTASIKLKIQTGGDIVDVFVITDNLDDTGELTPIYVGSILNDVLSEVILDVSEMIGICKTVQFRIIGLVSDFELASIIVDFTLRPEQTSYVRINLMDL